MLSDVEQYADKMRAINAKDYTGKWSEKYLGQNLVQVRSVLCGEPYRNCWWFFDRDFDQGPAASTGWIEFVCEIEAARTLTKWFVSRALTTSLGLDRLLWDVAADTEMSGYVYVVLRTDRSAFRKIKRRMVGMHFKYSPDLSLSSSRYAAKVAALKDE